MRDLVEHRLGDPLLVEQVVVVLGNQVSLLQYGSLQATQTIHGLDLGRKDDLVVRLCQKVVTAGLKAAYQGTAFGQRGEKNDRHQRLTRQLLDPTGSLEAVHHRHQGIHQHQLRAPRLEDLDRFGAVAGRQHRMPLTSHDARQQ